MESKQMEDASAREILMLARSGNGDSCVPLKAMPNYDYECETCGKRFEVFQSMNDAKLTDCPDASCEGKVKRLLGTGGGIIFKGSGFYQTDYRSASYQAGAKEEKGGSKTSAPSCGKTDCCAVTPAAPAKAAD